VYVVYLVDFFHSRLLVSDHRTQWRNFVSQTQGILSHTTFKPCRHLCDVNKQYG